MDQLDDLRSSDEVPDLSGDLRAHLLGQVLDVENVSADGVEAVPVTPDEPVDVVYLVVEVDRFESRDLVVPAGIPVEGRARSVDDRQDREAGALENVGGDPPS